uniref:Uncharacterized protein n=1 Tax=Knipowitschia caucasica TaxID=637954 RepID=A0AAV2J660_KNICA
MRPQRSLWGGGGGGPLRRVRSGSQGHAPTQKTGQLCDSEGGGRGLTRLQPAPQRGRHPDQDTPSEGALSPAEEGTVRLGPKT